MVYAQAERVDTIPLFLLYPHMYSVVVRFAEILAIYVTGCEQVCIDRVFVNASFYVFSSS